MPLFTVALSTDGAALVEAAKEESRRSALLAVEKGDILPCERHAAGGEAFVVEAGALLDRSQTDLPAEDLVLAR